MAMSALASHARVKAIRAAARGCEIKTGEAKQDCRGSTIEERMQYRRTDSAFEHVTDEIGKRHFAGEDEGHRTREQSEQEQPAPPKFHFRSGCDQGRKLRKIRQHRKFQELGDAILKQQQAGNKTKQAESRRLIFGKSLVHVMS